MRKSRIPYKQTEAPTCCWGTKSWFQDSLCCCSIPFSLCLLLSSCHAQFEKRMHPLLQRRCNKRCHKNKKDLQIQEVSWPHLCSQTTKFFPIGARDGCAGQGKPFDTANLFPTLIKLNCPQWPLSHMHTYYAECIFEQLVRQQALAESSIEGNRQEEEQFEGI